MIERDPYIAIEEAERLGASDRATLYRCMDDRKLAWKPSEEKSGNGRVARLVRVADLPKKAQENFWQETLKPATGTTPTVNLAEFAEPVRDEAMRRWHIVHDVLVLVEQQRGGMQQALRAAASQGKDGARTIERWVAAYRADGLAGLLPKWGTKQGTFTAVGPALGEYILATIRQTPKMRRTDLQRAVAKYCDKQLHCAAPSVATINRYIEATTTYPERMAWEGPRTYRAKAMPKIHRDYLDLAVGEMWVGDHRLLDVFVRLSADPEAKAFRPWLTAWMDLRSRTIVGWHLDLVPNSDTIAQALRAGILQYGVPRRLYMDNGKDYTCHYWGGHPRRPQRADFHRDARGVLALLKIGVTHAQAYSPWSKAIEAWFGHCLPAWECTLPGWCGSDNKAKPERLSGEIAAGKVLTIDQLRTRLEGRIEQYHDAPHSGQGMNGATPRSLWEGVAKEIPDESALDLLLMRHKAVTVTAQGIWLFGFRYWHDELFDLQRKPHVEARYASANINQLRIFHAGKYVCTAMRQAPFSSDLSESEKNEITRLRAAAKKRLEQHMDDRAIVLDRGEAERRIVNARQPKTYILKRTPRPAPGGAIIPRITGMEHAAVDSARDVAIQTQHQEIREPCLVNNQDVPAALLRRTARAAPVNTDRHDSILRKLIPVKR